MRDRVRRSYQWLLAAGGVLVLAGAYWVAGPHLQVGATTTWQGRFACPPNVSSQKCGSLTGRPAIRSQSTPTPVIPPTAASRSSSSLIKPGPGFFTASVQSPLAAEYGMVTIFRYHDWWVVLGNGQNQTSLATPPPMTPGGPLVAVEKCLGTNLAGCLSPDTAHALVAFTVVPPPVSGRPLAFFGTDAGHLLYFANNLTLNLNTQRWYRASVTAVAAHPSAFQALATSPPTQGIDLP